MGWTIFFDFDGVLVDSVGIKTTAMRQLFASENAQQLEEIIDLHRRYAGVNRFEKFDIIYSNILRRPLSKAKRDQLGEDFSRLVFEAICDCPALPGAIEFIRRRHQEFQLFVISGTPDSELREIMDRRDMLQYFREVHGSPRTKSVICQDIMDRFGLNPHGIVFIGDALSDREAAGKCDLNFLGVVGPGESNPFGTEARIIPDLTYLDTALTTLKR